MKRKRFTTMHVYYAYNITHFQPLLIGLGHVEVHSVREYTYNVVMLIIGVVSFPGLKYDTNGDTSYYDIMHYKGCLLNKRLQFERGVHNLGHKVCMEFTSRGGLISRAKRLQSFSYHDKVDPMTGIHHFSLHLLLSLLYFICKPIKQM